MSHGRALIITDGGVGGLLACWAEGVIRAERAVGLAGGRESGRDGEREGGGEGGAVAWLAPLPMPARQSRREAAHRHVELCSLASIVERPVETLEREAGELPAAAAEHGLTLNDAVSGSLATRLLLAAAEDAVRLGISRIVWPVHLGDWWENGRHRGGAEAEAVERAAGVFERALLVGQLASIDLAEGLRAEGVRIAAKGVTIETPYLDLSDAQVMELAVDMDCPVAGESGAWVCERGAGSSAGLARWPGCGACASCVRWRRALRAVDPACAAADA